MKIIFSEIRRRHGFFSSLSKSTSKKLNKDVKKLCIFFALFQQEEKKHRYNKQMQEKESGKTIKINFFFVFVFKNVKK